MFGIKNLTTVLVIVAILAVAIFYIIKAKKSGKKCIGCPDGNTCGSHQNCTGACGAYSSCDDSGEDNDK